MMKSLSLVAPLLFLLPLLVAVEPRKTLTTASTFVEPRKVVPVDVAHVKGLASAYGGYQPIGFITDPHIQNLGRFAVNEHNKEAKTQLQFVQVYGGQYQVVAGTKYKLLIKASNGGPIGNYGATIYEDLEEKLQLEEFNTIPRN